MSSTLRKEFNSSPDGEGDWICYISPNCEWGSYGMDEWIDLEWQGRPALPFFGSMSECPPVVLDKEYGTGFGAPERPLYAVWTTTWVVVPTEYDGATGVVWYPRNPARPTTASEILAAKGIW